MIANPSPSNEFQKKSNEIAFNREHRKKINFNISKYDTAVDRGKKQYSNLELAKRKAASVKHKVINDLDKYLIEFEKNFEERGGKVIWALDAQDAVREILSIVKNNHATMAVKSKSMITEEIELNHHLEKAGVEAVETDLGEYIVQQANQKPYHIVTPAMHLSKEDVAAIFTEKHNLPPNSSPEKITLFVRKILREKFQKAEVGITGANFLIADTGSIALTENEGNGVMSMSFPKIHIAIAGIERLIPSIKDLDLFWPLLSTFGTGQKLSAYNSVVSGARQEGETDGPQTMYVVLLDNNRTELLAEPRQRRALSCIRCGACLNACPVYKNIGGHAYGTTYSGPIGAVINPFLIDFEKYKHQSFASSLCGKCTEVCPVKINLHELLIINRHESVVRKTNTKFEWFSMFVMKKFMLNRKNMDRFSANIKNWIMKKFFKKAWGSRRELPVVQPKSFRQMWEERKTV
jgi:L-lactate dehydrogenase complex protein LldF